jgi:hypothetical protein
VRVPRWNGGLVSILVPEQIIIADAAFVGHEPVQFTGFIGWVDPAATFDALPDHQWMKIFQFDSSPGMMQAFPCCTVSGAVPMLFTASTARDGFRQSGQVGASG